LWEDQEELPNQLAVQASQLEAVAKENNRSFIANNLQCAKEWHPRPAHPLDFSSLSSS